MIKTDTFKFTLLLIGAIVVATATEKSFMKDSIKQIPK